MKKNLPLLQNLRVASPCPAKWEEMEGDERSRFCGSCRLNVYNLSDMTADEAEAFLRNATGRVCARYYQRDDGSIMTRDCPVGLAACRARVAKGLTIAVAFAWACALAVGRTAGNGERHGSIAELKQKVREVQPFKLVLDAIDPQPPTPTPPLSRATLGKPLVVGAMPMPSKPTPPTKGGP